METQSSMRPPADRQPLAEITGLANVKRLNADEIAKVGEHNIPGNPGPGLRTKYKAPKFVRQQAQSQSQARGGGGGHAMARAEAQERYAEYKRLSAMTQESHASSPDSRRVSSPLSDASAASRIKVFIGPWELGRSLGAGSSARVRKGRHRVTRQLAAVKIVSRKVVMLQQAGSLANLELVDTRTKTRTRTKTTASGGPDADQPRMPLAVEREVAILKLIDHPNIMKLYDIWENREDIYLVTEYVDQGDLFSYINTKGALSEQEAVCYFRQMMRALEYCHSLNICHRDLKPENILLTSDGTVKIADFSMAALQQDPTHQLRTACGSPHYAAPELLRHQRYKGSAADIWSMGVILWAMLSATLPFDDPDMAQMLARAKAGKYRMPDDLSSEARDLLRRILVTQPAQRITMKQMWRHALVKKYDHLDAYLPRAPRELSRDEEIGPIPAQLVDPHILRQLLSLWHAFDEAHVLKQLGSHRLNDQKIFYNLLLKYRDSQTENYNANIPVSKTDFHHMRPTTTWGKRISTCQFTEPRRNGHAGSVSRFTVISNVTEPPEKEQHTDTLRSYDPYNASRTMRTSESQVSHARVVIHRNGPADAAAAAAAAAASSSSLLLRDGTHVSHTYHAYRAPGAHQAKKQKRMNSQRTATSASVSVSARSLRGSVGSLPSSRHGGRVHAGSRYRRGVDFSNMRKPMSNKARSRRSSVSSGQAPASINMAGGDYAATLGRDPYASPRKRAARRDGTTQSMSDMGKTTTRQRKEEREVWTEELKQLGNSIAKDCDEAFGSSLLGPDASEPDVHHEISALSLSLGPSPLERRSENPDVVGGSMVACRPTAHRWDSRPLPPPPPEDASTPSALSRTRGGIIGGGLGGQRGHGTDRRVVTTPLYHQYGKLPAIDESTPRPLDLGRIDKQRNSSAPTPLALSTSKDTKGLDFLAQADRTIWMVTSPTNLESEDQAMACVPEPLKVKKKLPVQPREVTDDEADAVAASAHRGHTNQTSSVSSDWRTVSQSTTAEGPGPKRKVSSWFRRSSKGDVTAVPAKQASVHSQATSDPYRSSSQSTGCPPPVPEPAKRKSFGFPFFKSHKSDFRLSLAGPDYQETASPDQHEGRLTRPAGFATRASPGARSSATVAGSAWEDGEAGGRKIEVHQNWLARLFHIKPATRFMCFVISKRRARQEMAILLREWRKHGIKGVQVDKERNIVFARVASKNALKIKQVEFAIEIMTVIEHGKRNHLALARFTQERGAASSFHKVVDSVSSVFGSRGLLVAERRKCKMMIKTLNAT